jgi:hypothetical protein
MGWSRRFKGKLPKGKEVQEIMAKETPKGAKLPKRKKKKK